MYQNLRMIWRQRRRMFKVPNQFRLHGGNMGSSDLAGNNGAFLVELRKCQRLRCIASDQMGWEHVSVSRTDRLPLWSEMCEIKDMFWDKQDCVVQYHPPESDYINNHPNCLHMWRQVGKEFPRPPSIMVGVR